MGLKKYIALAVVCVSLFISGFSQAITLNDTPFVYNAYFQIALGFGVFQYLSHKLLDYYDNRHSKPVFNARDLK